MSEVLRRHQAILNFYKKRREALINRLMLLEHIKKPLYCLKGVSGFS